MTIQIALHLISVIPAMMLGVMILINKKGTLIHKIMGRIWVVLMFVAAISSFFIKSEGTFSWIHLLSITSLASIFLSIWGIRHGNVKRHKGFMIGAYCGAIVAGIFSSIVPGRIVHTFLFGVS